MTSPTSLSAEYLGWKPTEGVYGRQFIQPVVRDLVERRSSQHFLLKRHAMEFSHGKLRIWEMEPPHRSGGGAASSRHGNRYPSIPVSDITFALHEDVDSDPLVFSVILLGFNEESNRSVHAHVWRGQSYESVAGFVSRLVRHLTSQDHLHLVRQRELELVRQGLARQSGYFGVTVGGVAGRPISSPDAAILLTSPPPPPLPPPPPQTAPAQQMGILVAEELKQKLTDVSGVPLLHPPRDYDTISRSHGNVMLRRMEQPLCSDTKAPTGAYIRRSVIAAESAAASAPTNGFDANDLEPPPDYDDTDDENGSGTLNSSRGLDASNRLSSSGHSSISDHSADPAKGFSTWRKRRLQIEQQQQQRQRPSIWPPT